MAALSFVLPAPAANQAREALVWAIGEANRLRARVEELDRPVQRLQGIIDELAGVDRQLADHARVHEAAIGEWIASDGTGERPELPAASIGLRQRSAALTPLATGARTALPAAIERRQAVERDLVAAAERQAECGAAAAREIAIELIESEFRPTLRRLLEIEARVQGVINTLNVATHRTSSPIRTGASEGGKIAGALRQHVAPVRPVDASDFLNAVTGGDVEATPWPHLMRGYGQIGSDQNAIYRCIRQKVEQIPIAIHDLQLPAQAKLARRRSDEYNPWYVHNSFWPVDKSSVAPGFAVV